MCCFTLESLWPFGIEKISEISHLVYKPSLKKKTNGRITKNKDRIALKNIHVSEDLEK